jgi:hypothetical protein
MNGIRCGNRDHETETYHRDVATVRRCCSTETTWPCSWHVPVYYEEDGETGERPCGGLSWYLPDARGYECENGHDHIYDEVRAAEGWDYAADPDEAGLLAGVGVRPVAMDGGPIEVNPAAMLYAMRG